MRALEPLRAAFAGVTMIDTDAFTKTRCRQEAQFRHDGKLVWRKHPTPPGAPIDALLQQNVAALHSHHIILARTHAEKLRDAASERSEERSAGKECVSTCRSRRSPYH